MKIQHIILGITALIIGAFSISCKNESGTKSSTLVKDTLVFQDTIVFEYGIIPDSLKRIDTTVNRNQTLSDLLSPWGVSAQQLNELVRKSDTVFNIRHIRSGYPYSLFFNDTVLDYMVYEKSPLEYVIFQFTDSTQVRLGVRPTSTKIKQSSGKISSSLYQTLADENLNPNLALKLANIYAWEIDFYRIQKGDSFIVRYEEIYVEDQPYGIGEIIAANFIHFGKTFDAYRFVQDSVPDYFDDNGNSLRRAFLKSPLKFGRISSRYNPRRFHPVQKRYKAHKGTDYAAPYGTPILVTGSGTVIAATRSTFNGRYVKIKHNNTFTTQYLHMQGFAKGVRKGSFVRQGEVIGYVGSTGLATGPHVCYRFWKNGQQIDHLKEDFPPDTPVKPELKKQFILYADSLQSLLNE